MNDVSGKLQPQAWMTAPETRKLMQALLEDGGDARFVGGCVRDALINRAVTDIDIATPLLPAEVIARLARHEIPYAPTGLKHGTVTAIVDGRPFEITTLRLDVTTFGRHADVQYTDNWKTDASRRDFTINAMSATVDGDVFDPFGGIGDLRLGRVRFVGEPEKRLHEDVLRILRFFRFYAHFGREEPDPAALQACTAAAAKIVTLSGERIRQEILKLLESDRCAEVWLLMLEHGIVAQFLPEATHTQALKNMVRLEAARDSKPFALRRLAAVLAMPDDRLSPVARSLRLSNDQAAQLLKMRENSAAAMGSAALKQLVYRHGNDTARNVLLVSAARTGEADIGPALWNLATSFHPPRFPLTGDDVLKLGYAPGPDIGRLLTSVEDWWIGRDFMPGRTECLEALRNESKKTPA